jgi:hypothetical protein
LLYNRCFNSFHYYQQVRNQQFWTMLLIQTVQLVSVPDNSNRDAHTLLLLPRSCVREAEGYVQLIAINHTLLDWFICQTWCIVRFNLPVCTVLCPLCKYILRDQTPKFFLGTVHSAGRFASYRTTTHMTRKSGDWEFLFARSKNQLVTGEHILQAPGRPRWSSG